MITFLGENEKVVIMPVNMLNLYINGKSVVIYLLKYLLYLRIIAYHHFYIHEINHKHDGRTLICSLKCVNRVKA